MLLTRATSECVISTLVALGASRTEAEAAHRLWCPADCLEDRVGRATPYPSTESGDAAIGNVRVEDFGYQSSTGNRYLSVELSRLHFLRRLVSSVLLSSASLIHDVLRLNIAM